MKIVHYLALKIEFLLSFKKQGRCKFKEIDLMKKHKNDFKHLKSSTCLIFSCMTIIDFQSYDLMKVYVTKIKRSLFN